MMDRNVMMMATSDNIGTKLAPMLPAVKSENALTAETLLFGKQGRSGVRSSHGGKGPEMDTRYNKNDRNVKDHWKYIHCQLRGHITESCLSMLQGDPLEAAYTAANPMTETTLTLNTVNKNYQMVASLTA